MRVKIAATSPMLLLNYVHRLHARAVVKLSTSTQRCTALTWTIYNARSSINVSKRALGSKVAPFTAAADGRSIYDFPFAYDLGFKFRDFDKEITYLLAAYNKHCQGALGRFLEVG
jgi:hypothetical protein